MPKRVYSVDTSYFKNIDNQEKAYILGFIFADGNINNYLKEGKYRLRVTLKASDKELLEKIKKQLNYTGDIKVRTLKSLKFPERNNYEICELSIMSKELILDLVSWGAVPCKSFKVQFPPIPSKYKMDFIRGYFDGNGSITRRKDRPKGVNCEVCSASESFIKSVKEVTKELIGIDVNIYKKRSVYVISLSQNKARIFLKALYEGATIYLERKYQLFKELV